MILRWKCPFNRADMTYNERVILRTWCILPLLALCAAGLAAPMDNYRNGTDFSLMIDGGSGLLTVILAPTPVTVDPTPWFPVTKPSGQMNGTIDLADFLPGSGISGAANFTAADLGSNRIRWAITAPSVIGQTFQVPINGELVNIKVTSITGTLTANLVPREPYDDPIGNYGRNLDIVKDPAGTNNFTLRGNIDGNPFLPVKLEITTIEYHGLAGDTPVNRVTGTVELQDTVGSSLNQVIEIQFRDSNGATLSTRYAVLDANGAYECTSVHGGTLDIFAKGLHWLRQGRLGHLMLPINSGMDFSLVNGDADGDNAVTLLDYDLFSTQFDTALPQSDFDLDGQVTLLDYDIFSESFDKVGEG